jgi:LmbE family N-acetylglucosaminyl deacetylase
MMNSSTTAAVPLLDPRRHVFLSPHYDDIALSTGATVGLLASAGLSPETVVVFGDEPDPSLPLTSFAEQLHSDWALTANEVITRRRAEESAAAAVLGASTAVLPFRDAIYRDRHYLSNDDLFGIPATAESNLPEQIARSLALDPMQQPETRLYGPLGVGRHVDHQLVFQAALQLAGAGWDVWFYEDIPYALRPDALETRLREIDAEVSLEPVAHVPVEESWTRKLDAIQAYPSQLQTVFTQYVGVGTSREEISDALLAYARGAGGEGVPAERFWRVAAR